VCLVDVDVLVALEDSDAVGRLVYRPLERVEFDRLGRVGCLDPRRLTKTPEGRFEGVGCSCEDAPVSRVECSWHY